MRDKTERNWYKDMFLLGTALNGQIRCSYLALYDKEGNFLFSLSPKPTFYTGGINLSVSTAEHLIGVRSGTPIEVVDNVKITNKESNTALTMESYSGDVGEGSPVADFKYVIPVYNPTDRRSYPISYMDFVVTAEEYVEGKYVPVKLTYYANKHIQEVIASSGRRSYYQNSAKYLRFKERLLPMLKANEDFYIQPYQVKWYPANLDRYNEIMSTDYKPFTTEYTAKYTTSEQAKRYMKLSKIAEAASVITLFT